MSRDGSLGSAAAMVDTPWGPSESLRDRMLRPGPGTPAEDVARNQRGRLFGAMVASVAERGYAATRLSDLAELSGVSRNSFYRLFPDKEACFVAAAETILAETIKAMTLPSGSWEAQVRAAAMGFAELVVAYPAAARMCLIDVYAVGEAGLAPLEEATAKFEAHAIEAALEFSEEAEALPAMISAHVGALMEIARERLRLGTEAELPGAMNDFAELVLSYQPPPQPLRLATRLPTPAPETLDAHGHSERVLRAFAAVVAEHGYANTTVEMVVKLAVMSPRTFYAHFSSKDDALFAAIDNAGAQLIAAIMPNFRRNADWTQGVRAAFGDFFGFLASRPTLAKLLMVEIYGAGPAALERREEALRPLRLLLAEGRARVPQVPAIAIGAIAGGVYRLAYKQIRESGPESLPNLAPICTYMTLAPFIGARAASEVASGDGRGRSPGSGGDGADRMLISRVGLIIGERPASAEEVAREVGDSVERVRGEIANLMSTGLIIALEEETEGGESEVVYHPNTDFIDEDRWAEMSLAERQAASRQIANLVIAEIEQAIELGTFDARLDRHLSRTPLLLDAQGWRELMALHEQTFHTSIEIQSRSADRLQRSGEPSIFGTSLQALFEVPKS
jgi:AcrR family transcriptional regulator